MRTESDELLALRLHMIPRVLQVRDDIVEIDKEPIVRGLFRGIESRSTRQAIRWINLGFP